MSTKELISDETIEDIYLQEMNLKLTELGFKLVHAYSESFLYEIPGTTRRAILDVSNNIKSLELFDTKTLKEVEVYELRRYFSSSLLLAGQPEFANRNKEAFFKISPRLAS